MKNFLFFLASSFFVSFVFAQNSNPVNWSFGSKKINDNLYELQMVANIEPGWHLYAQMQPAGAIAVPTSFNFNKNPLLILDGKVKEQGKLIRFKDKTLGIQANEYNDKVVFTQKVKLKGKAKTSLTGKLEFQTCNDQRCLPPKTINLSIAL
ncbi:MAG: hypothetical protein NVS1B13_01560 [Flavisolibacter sp.]